MAAMHWHRYSLFGAGAVCLVLLAPPGCGDKGGARSVNDADACPAVKVPEPCQQDSALCIPDLRAVRDRFPTCQTGQAWEPFLASCGDYDGVVYAGVDSATIFHFERTEGRLVGITNVGSTTLPPCESIIASFRPSTCDPREPCPTADGGGE